jgi:sigma-B regulation protein RsbU (phosphoserine phosphatase)
VNSLPIGKYRIRMTRLRVSLLAAVALDALLMATGSLSWLTSLINVVLVVWGSWKLLGLALSRSQLIWKVRNRLIVTYLFIAVVPIALILAFFLVAGWTLTAQFAGYMVSAAMENRERSIETPARLLARELPADRMAIVQQLTATGIPSFEALVTGNQVFRYPADSTIRMPPGDWKDYTGVVYKARQPYLMSLVGNGRNRSLILVPLTRDVLEKLVPGLGSLGMPESTPQSTADESTEVETNVSTYRNAIAGLVPPQQNMLDFAITGFAPIEVAEWNRPNSGNTKMALIVTRMSAVLGVVFPSKISEPLLPFVIGFYVIVVMLGLAELVSWYIGISMTGTITGAVHNLYEGTKKIGEGAFAYRIPVRGRDQLAELGHSFNKMAEQLEQFVEVTREKERLQSEIAIASEVQTRLFPHKPPASDTVGMLGVCHAARMVSGDYYDYFVAADGELAIALGDVAGKGISAALLMASIQSIMRTQLSDAGAAVTPANTVARLNRLLYASTSPEKYATFFFGLYNENTRRIRYTNAGHLPPLLIHGDDYEFLEVTGSVPFTALRGAERAAGIRGSSYCLHGWNYRA